MAPNPKQTTMGKARGGQEVDRLGVLSLKRQLERSVTVEL